ncbi:hypothetical protein T492DRAFT_870135 [Pavlovales sp. CCMP2436]|nr:hypothetical protein T492DRAFT_870135 [Pavlovales sp. CCMP2436]
MPEGSGAVATAVPSVTGYHIFAPLVDVRDPSVGFLDDDGSLEITCTVEVTRRQQDAPRERSDEEAVCYTVGNDQCFGLVDHARVSSFRVKKEETISDLKAMFARELGVPVPRMRLWT